MSSHAQAITESPAVGQDAAKCITAKLADRVGTHRYQMWFGATSLRVQGKTVQLETDSQFVAQWIEKHFDRELRDVSRDVLGDAHELIISIVPTNNTISANATPPGHHHSPLQFPVDGTNDASSMSVQPRSARTTTRRSTLRRLEDYVVGPSNKLAYAAATTIVNDRDAEVISPLFIHGECGVGKTHLLQGVSRRAAERHGASNVRYVTAEQFTNEYIASVRNQTIDAFRNRVRKLECLAIDDVQFLSNKSRTQNEFLYTLDAIDHLGAKIVLASNEHPRQIKKFSPALISRLLAGMVVQIDPPDRTTRIKLVHRIAAARNLLLLDAAAELIATRCVGSVRELEGTITKLAAMHSLATHAETTKHDGPREIGLLLVQRLFADQAFTNTAPVRIGGVLDAVCTTLGVTRNDLCGSGRHRRVVLARGLVAYLGRELTTLSYPEIAQAMGRPHHSTVHTAARRLKAQLAANDHVVLQNTDTPIALTDLIDRVRHEIRRD